MTKPPFNKWQIPNPEGRILGEIIVKYIDGRNWELVYDVAYRTLKGELSTVHAPFIFDFASIPRIFWFFYPPTGNIGSPYGIAALFHDYLYCHRKIDGRPITRKEADLLFYEIMAYTGVGWFTRHRMYRAVRMFGWIPWGRRKPEDIIP